jgi:hypothetical protein
MRRKITIKEIGMESQTPNGLNAIAVGDHVVFIDKAFSNEIRTATVKIIDVRRILGQLSYVIETNEGKRKVIGPGQIVEVVQK